MEDVVKLNWLPVNKNAELNILKLTHKSLYDEKFPEYFNYLIYTRPGGGGYSQTLPIRVCAAQRGRDFEAPDLERGIHFRGVF